MKIKIDYLKKLARETDFQITTLALALDKYECVADEDDIKDLAETLRYLADLVESIPIE